MTPQSWTKIKDGYSITDSRWGANIKVVTDTIMSDAELAWFLNWLYENHKPPLARGSHWSFFLKGPIPSNSL